MNITFTSNPSKDSMTGGVAYYYHFRKDFLAPYGMAFKENAFDNKSMDIRLKSMNCEFLCRANVELSELAGTIVQNFDYIQENYQDMTIERSIEKLLNRYSKICKHLMIIDTTKPEHTGRFEINTIISRTLIVFFIKIVILFSGDIEESLRKVIKFMKEPLPFMTMFVKEGLKFLSALYLPLIWMRVANYIFNNPKQVAEKFIHSENKFY